MKRFRLILSVVIVFFLIVVSCNILKKEDNVAGVKNFLALFEKSLSAADEEILKQFEVAQSQESLLTAIRILQNKEHERIACLVDFSDASIFPAKEEVTVELKVSFKSLDSDDTRERVGKLVLKLQRKNNSFVITEFDGNDFHRPFAWLRSDLLWSSEQENETVRRQSIYRRARELQQKFDSVIWFARYKDANYFYVVNGDWDIEKFSKGTSEALMGIVDDTGKEIVPVQYTFIGTMGTAETDIVEVGNGGKLGYFNINTKQLVVDTKYDMIIPYRIGEAIVIVKNDSTYGWIDGNGQQHSGFPNLASEAWVSSFGFVPSNIRISNDSDGLCEPPTEAQIGRGIFMPASFLVHTSIFDRVVDGISTTAVPMHGWTEYIETSDNRVTSITDGISAFITSFTERYLEGREEFYTNDHLVFIDGDNRIITSTFVFEDPQITRVNDSIIQMKGLSQDDIESEFEDMSGVPPYRFFKLSGKSIEILETNSAFSPPWFVKLDSTYLEGNFSWYPESGDSKEITFFSLAAVTSIRNELLARNGYRFPEPELQERFSYIERSSPVDSIDEAIAAMSEIERYNYHFLERMISRMQGTAM
jgi:hypothetical protein